MIALKKVQGDNVPEEIEYLGGNEWAVRWDVEFIETTDMNDNPMKFYTYYELKFNEEPTYDIFVSELIRQKYTRDQEDALKSNMVEQLTSGIAVASYADEWEDFQAYRNEAKNIGKQIFNKLW